jgi:RNA polymerase sigma-70 factor (ECF subfamily)
MVAEVSGRTAPTASPLPRVLGRSAATMAAFQDLYVEQFPSLVRYATRALHDADLAGELVQEAYTKLLARWRDADDPGAYVYVILTNLIRNHWRSVDRERSAVSSLRVTTAEAEAASRAHEVRDAIDRLPRKLRELVLLRYVADLPMDEVARALGRPLGTVKRQLHEARTLLHDTLGEARDA